MAKSGGDFARRLVSAAAQIVHDAMQAGAQIDITAVKRNGREAPRGAEVQALDLIFDVLTSEQPAKLLRGPLITTYSHD